MTFPLFRGLSTLYRNERRRVKSLSSSPLALFSNPSHNIFDLESPSFVFLFPREIDFQSFFFCFLFALRELYADDPFLKRRRGEILIGAWKRLN